MVVEKKILGLEEDGNIDILDVKCDPDLVGMIIQTYGFLPGYHMNKQHWITILLDDSVSEAKTLDFLFHCHNYSIPFSIFMSKHRRIRIFFP